MSDQGSRPPEGRGEPARTDADLLAERHRRWEDGARAESQDRLPPRKERFTTLSGIDIKDVYTPADLNGTDYLRDIGFPGEYPYTRGPHATMYRSRPWTIRQVAGFGTGEDTNRRYKYLMEQGETGLSTDFDLPTLLGRDSDHPMSVAEVGRIGVAVDSLVDIRLLMQGIPLDRVSTSYTINASAFVLMAMYEAVAKEQGVPDNLITGTLQNDILKEYTAQNEFIYPPEESVELVVDTLEYGAQQMPRYNPISVSGYHIREAGATAVQELAFTLGAGHAYVEAAKRRGLDPDLIAPRISFFFDLHNDFFEEIAKLRAARRLWARLMRDLVGARSPRSWLLRAHCQTAGVSLTAQQPENNVIRTTIQALAGVLGGTQSLHTNSKDEAYQIPSEEAIKIAVRTQQILLHENRVADVVDPLAGSFYVERLTTEVEEAAEALIEEILKRGGMVQCIRAGYIQQQIADSSAAFQTAVEDGRERIVGVNIFEEPEVEDLPFESFEIDPRTTERQLERLARTRSERDGAEVGAALKELDGAARRRENVMPHVARAVRGLATVGEVCDVLREVYGEYRPPVVY